MDIKTFIKQVRTNVAYDEKAKRQFHSRAEAVLRALAVKLGYKKGDFDLRHNQGGIACSGEIMLHSDTLYIQFSQSCLGPDYGFMWRKCQSRKDNVGGRNRWMTWEQLADLDTVAQIMLAVVD